jgi:hypothetical protein
MLLYPQHIEQILTVIPYRPLPKRELPSSLLTPPDRPPMTIPLPEAFNRQVQSNGNLQTPLLCFVTTLGMCVIVVCFQEPPHETPLEQDLKDG